MPPASATLFGDLLRQYRVAAGLTQAALAERAGLSVHGIQKLERGVTRPYRHTAQRLESALALPLLAVAVPVWPAETSKLFVPTPLD